jgi:hypothetical protein
MIAMLFLVKAMQGVTEILLVKQTAAVAAALVEPGRVIIQPVEAPVEKVSTLEIFSLDLVIAVGLLLVVQGEERILGL